MTEIRERSGRSGRRRGSQKPGTACGAASTGLGAVCMPGTGLAGALGVPCASAGPHKVAASKQARDSDRTRNDEMVCNGLAGDFGCSGAL